MVLASVPHLGVSSADQFCECPTETGVVALQAQGALDGVGAGGLNQ